MDPQVLPNSSKVYPDNLNLFSVPSTNVGVVSSDYLTIYPSNSLSLDSSSPLTFAYTGTNVHYLDLSSSYIYLEGQILNADGTNLDATANVTFNEDIASNIFESAELTVNSFPVYRSTNLYPYYCHYNTLLSYGEGAKSSLLTASLFYPDDKVDIYDSSNKGFVTRKKLSDASAKFDFIRRVNISLFDQTRPLYPDTDFVITFRIAPDKQLLVGSRPSSSSSSTTGVTPASDEFPYKLAITKAMLFLRKMIINENIVKQHKLLLQQNKRLIYPCKHMDIKSFAIAANTTEFTSEILYNNTIPQFLVFGLVSLKAYYGDLGLSPFTFLGNDMESVSVLVDGESSSYKTISFGSSGKNFALGYYSLFQTLPREFTGNGIKREMYESKHLVVFELLPSKIPKCLSANKKGQIKVALKFHKPTSSALLCVVGTLFDSIVEIAADKSVYVDNLMM